VKEILFKMEKYWQHHVTVLPLPNKAKKS